MGFKIDLTGQKFGMLTVLKRSDTKNTYWECQCDCGGFKTISRSNLKSGKGLHCGCQKRKGRIMDLSGQRFGELLAVEISGKTTSGKMLWKCLCDCGAEVNIIGSDLRSGKSRSCGCAPRIPSSRRRVKHGESCRNFHTARYDMWMSASSRSKRKNLPFDITLEDVVIPETCPLLGVKLSPSKKHGACPESPTLDKIIPELGYVPGNVWVISHRANTIKSDASLEELKTLTANLEKKLNELNGDTSKD